MFDGMLAYSQGPVRALGLQRAAALIGIACYYIFSIPLAAIFAFWVRWSIHGLWGGFYVGVVITSILYMWLIFATSWEQVAEKAAGRIQGELEKLDPKQETVEGLEYEPLK